MHCGYVFSSVPRRIIGHHAMLRAQANREQRERDGNDENRQRDTRATPADVVETPEKPKTLEMRETTKKTRASFSISRPSGCGQA